MPQIKLTQLVGEPVAKSGSKDGKNFEYKIYQGLYEVDGKPNTLIKTFFEPKVGEEYDVEISLDKEGISVARKNKGSFTSTKPGYSRDYSKEYDYNAPSFALSYAKDMIIAGKGDDWFSLAADALDWLKLEKPGANMAQGVPVIAKQEELVDTTKMDLSDLPF